MADCVHIGCQEYISCRKVPGATGTDVGMCKWCGLAVVFVPADMLWIAASGHVRPDVKPVCHGKDSPDRRHFVEGK